LRSEQLGDGQHVRAVVGEIVVEEVDHRVPPPKAQERTGGDRVVDAGREAREVVARMAAHLGRDDAEAALEAAAAGSFHQVEQRIDAAPDKQSVVDRVGRDAVDRRAIDRLERSAQVIRHDVPHAVDAAGADDVEEPGGELGKRRANASASHDGGAAAAKEIRELAHAVEVGLESREEHQVVSRTACGIERSVPVLVVQAHVEVPLVDEGADMEAGNRLHEISRPPLVAAGAQVRADDQCPSSRLCRSRVARRATRRTPHT
jgi:hypothetical protein